MNSISHSHKAQINLCRALEFSLIFFMLLLPLSCMYFIFLSDYNNEHLPLDAKLIEWTLADNTYYIVDNLVMFFVLLQMYIFCRGVRQGELFTNKRIKNVKHIGLTLIIGYILNLFIRVFFESSMDEWNSSYMLTLSNELYSLQQLLLGGGVLSLSYIFEKGSILKQENELVI
ncbi:hypothetical protein C4513_16760 [Morganella morganii]|uniref:DUF2975 domain-containing protein n=1 Tax=Morganellaceae TaxID=1903414 RepID=UPI00128C949B|nr:MULTISPECIES: DUF2975 domain-containing protein [Morganellaceae]MQC12496.1 hypothetical protein [Morganella morganii]